MHEPRETEHEPVVITERHGPVAHVILNRPSARNAADLALQTELPRALRAAGADPEVAAIVLSGRGPAFSAGGDRTLLDSVVAGADAALDAELRQLTVELLWLLLDELRQPVVTAVHGYAIGWGAGLVALSDLVVMEEDAYLQDPHGKYGLPASPGCEVVWSRTLPPPVLKEVLILGRRVTADEALRWGLVNRVVPTGTAVTAALHLAAELSALPADGVAAIKRSSDRESRDALAATWPR